MQFGGIKYCQYLKDWITSLYPCSQQQQDAVVDVAEEGGSLLNIIDNYFHKVMNCCDKTAYVTIKQSRNDFLQRKCWLSCDQFYQLLCFIILNTPGV